MLPCNGSQGGLSLRRPGAGEERAATFALRAVHAAHAEDAGEEAFQLVPLSTPDAPVHIEGPSAGSARKVSGNGCQRCRVGLVVGPAGACVGRPAPLSRLPSSCCDWRLFFCYGRKC
jgi:hypothetical protein